MSRLHLLVDAFRLSCSELSNASGKRISRSQVHRVISGAHQPSPLEKQAIAVGILECLRARTDSAFIFDDDEEAQP